jgi:hypothetical protein
MRLSLGKIEGKCLIGKEEETKKKRKCYERKFLVLTRHALPTQAQNNMHRELKKRTGQVVCALFCTL